MSLPACSSGKSSGTTGPTGPMHGEVFPSDNPWNTDISKAAVDPKSDAYITNMGAVLAFREGTTGAELIRCWKLPV